MAYLKKEFWDTDNGIQSVLIHYTVSPLGLPANWAANAESRAMPAGEVLRTGVGEVAKYGPPAPAVPQFVHPRLRKKVLNLPQEVWDPRLNAWTGEYTLHYFYEILRYGQRTFTPVLTDEIRTREVVLIDPLGVISGACANWSVYDWDAPQFSPMEDPNFIAFFGEDHPLRQTKFYGTVNQEAFGVAKKAFVDLLPLPHAFRARVQAPVGATVRLRFHAGDWGLPEHRRWEAYILLNESFVMTAGAPPLVFAPLGTTPAPAPIVRVTPDLLVGNPYALLLPGYQSYQGLRPLAPAQAAAGANVYNAYNGYGRNGQSVAPWAPAPAYRRELVGVGY